MRQPNTNGNSYSYADGNGDAYSYRRAEVFADAKAAWHATSTPINSSA